MDAGGGFYSKLRSGSVPNPNADELYGDAPIFLMDASFVTRGHNLLGSPADLAAPQDASRSINDMWVFYSPTDGVLQVKVRLRGRWEK